MLPDEMRPPKTRFTSRDGSKEPRAVCSPRLKSFPAERIKKSDPTAEPFGALIGQQNPRETGTFFVGSTAKSNSDRDDAISSAQLHQQLKPCMQNTSSANKQQVAAGHQRIDQASPQSETQGIASVEMQARRPLVPSAFQAAAVRERSPRNSPTVIEQPAIVRGSSMQGGTMPQMQEARAVVNRDRNTLDGEINKQPIGDQNAANHGQTVMQMQRQQRQQAQAITRDASASLNNQSVNNYQDVHSQAAHHAQSHDPFRRMPPQIYQQSTQHNAHYRRTPQQALDRAQPSASSQQQQQQQTHNSGMCCSCCNHQYLSATQFPRQGMTSPQDMTMCQMRLTQRNSPGHQQNLEYPIGPQFAWPQNDRWAASRSQPHLHQLPSPRYYYQAQSSNFSRTNSDSQDQSVPTQSHESANQQSIAEARGRQGDRKRTLQFTPSMIRDQELLVAAMKQQGIPDGVMRRQFDALLNEQRKQLTYTAQFQQQKETPEIGRTYRVTRRGMERDEKPEWMVHITPPRISYSEMNRVSRWQGASKDRHSMDDQSSQKISRTMSTQRQDCRQREEAVDQSIRSQQARFQMNPHQLWQQQAANWSYRSDHQTPPCGHEGCYSYAHPQSVPSNAYQSSPVFDGHNQHQSFCQYPHNASYDLYRAHSEQQNAWSTERSANPSNTQDNRGAVTDSERFYEQNERRPEYSSLLKMRLYKEVIRPLKRNNGLQDLKVIQKTLESLEDPASRKGLEYLANLTQKKQVIRLNGVQNPNEIPEELRSQPPPQIAPQAQRSVSANGLENSRNANNPLTRVLRPNRADDPAMAEYPRQRQNSRACYSMQTTAERETSRQRDYPISCARNAEPVLYDRSSASAPVTPGLHSNNGTTTYRFIDSPHYQTYQQYCFSRPSFAKRNAGGQGDVAGVRRPDTPGATRIDRAGGDAGESPSAEETAKRIADGAQSMRTGANVYGQPENQDARNAGYAARPVGKPDCDVRNDLVVSPDKLLASRHLRPPMIF